MEKISVCIPAYNEEKLIRRCLESVTAQEGVDITEILVGINSSTDCTREIVEDYAKVDSRVRIVDSAKGKANAWNALNAIAENNLRIFQDGDCLVAQGTYAGLVSELGANDIVGASTMRDVKGKSFVVKLWNFPVKCVRPIHVLNGNLYLLKYSAVRERMLKYFETPDMPENIVNDDAFLGLVCEKVQVSRNIFIMVSVAERLEEEIRRRRRIIHGNLLIRRDYPYLYSSQKSQAKESKLINVWSQFKAATVIEKLLFPFLFPLRLILRAYVFRDFREVSLDDAVDWK